MLSHAVKRLSRTKFGMHVLMVLIDSCIRNYSGEPIHFIRCYLFQMTVIIDGPDSFPFPFFLFRSLKSQFYKKKKFFRGNNCLKAVNAVRINEIHLILIINKTIANLFVCGQKKILYKNISVFEIKILNENSFGV